MPNISIYTTNEVKKWVGEHGGGPYIVKLIEQDMKGNNNIIEVNANMTPEQLREAALKKEIEDMENKSDDERKAENSKHRWESGAGCKIMGNDYTTVFEAFWKNTYFGYVVIRKGDERLISFRRNKPGHMPPCDDGLHRNVVAGEFSIDQAIKVFLRLWSEALDVKPEVIMGDIKKCVYDYYDKVYREVNTPEVKPNYNKTIKETMEYIEYFKTTKYWAEWSEAKRNDFVKDCHDGIKKAEYDDDHWEENHKFVLAKLDPAYREDWKRWYKWD